MIKANEQYNIFDLGFNKYLIKGSSALESTIEKIVDDLPLPSILGSGFYEISPSQLGSGELGQNITMIAGLLQSSNFVSGSTGWRLTAAGDLEANSGTFRGALIGNSLQIGTDAIHIDTDGNMWWGSSSTYAGAIIKISSAGLVNFTSGVFSGEISASNYQLYQEYTAGENIAAGNLCCIKNKIETWGSGDTIADHRGAWIGADVYVDSSYPTTNYDTSGDLIVGGGSSDQKFIYLEVDTDAGALPAFNEVEKVILRLYMISNGLTANTIFKVYRVTSNWSEDTTVTWNNQPSRYGTFAWASLSLTTSSSAGYYDFDITELYKLWSLGGGYTKQGIAILPDAANQGIVTFGSKDRDGGGDFDQEPYLVITSNRDSDGKAYLASYSDYDKIKNIIGIATETIGSGNTIKVLSLLEKSYYMGNYPVGRNYYLVNSAGGLGTLATPIHTGKWEVKVGFGAGDRLIIENDKNPKFIHSFTYNDFHNTDNIKIVAPVQSTTAIIVYTLGIARGVTPILNKGSLMLRRDRIIDITERASAQELSASDAYMSMRGNWASNGILTITADTDDDFEVNSTMTVYFYE